MKKNSVLLLTLTFSSCTLSLCGCSNSSQAKGQRQKNNEVESFETNYGNKRTYNESFFYNPNNKYRVLPVNHQSALSPGGASTTKIDEYMERGYGGLVTNVALGENYLISESNWEMMAEAVKYGIDTYDMRLMIYDEEYYPSGGARQLTLSNQPEGENWEAQGLVYFDKVLTKGIPVTLDKQEGHTLIKAYVYKDAASISEFDPSKGVDILPTIGEGNEYMPEDDGFMCLLYHKNWYEGTHYQNNLMESRKYIDLLKYEPVQKFIEVTYEKYYEHFKEYFGKNLESFFFDEPSLPGFYFQPTSPQVLDPINPNIEQYPAVNFDDKIIEKFEKKYGYNPSSYLPYLFEKTNNNENIRRFRWQYYSLISEEVSKNFPSQLNTWASNHGVISTGHFLAEEDISDHPLMLGDYMEMYRNMSIPGIDLTHGSALDSLVIAANVAKQATSIGDFIGKQNVFCEIGQDEGAGANVYDNIASTAIMQSMGVDYLVSYYKLRKDEDDMLLANTLARINYLIDGNVGEKDVGIYYPIDGIMSSETPYNSNGQRIYTGSWGFNPYVSQINESYRTLCQTFIKNQIDYDIFSNYMIENSTIEGNHIKTPNGETFSTLVIPFTNAMKESVLNKISSFADAGVKIIFQNISSLLAESSESQKNVDEMLETLKTKANVSFINNRVANSILEKLDKTTSKTVNFTTPNPNIVARKQNNIDNTLYMLVNSSPRPQTITMEIPEIGSEYLSWDPYTGDVDGMCVEVRNNKSYITVTLDQYRVGMFTIGGNYHE